MRYMGVYRYIVRVYCRHTVYARTRAPRTGQCGERKLLTQTLVRVIVRIVSLNHFRLVPFGVCTAQKCVRSTRRCRVNSFAFASEYFYLHLHSNCTYISTCTAAVHTFLHTNKNPDLPRLMTKQACSTYAGLYARSPFSVNT